jgi:hypothetical protein
MARSDITREAYAAVQFKGRLTETRGPFRESALLLDVIAIGWHLSRNHTRTHIGHTVGPNVA